MNADFLMQYVSFRAGNDVATAEAYANLVNGLVNGSDGPNLFRVDPVHLLTSNSLVSLAFNRQTSQIVSGAHAVADGLSNIHLQGVVTDPTYRRLGIGRTVFGNCLVESALAYRSTDYRLVVREQNGLPALEAFSLYEGFGFRVVDRVKVFISGSTLDVHLRESAEGDRRDHFFGWKMAADIEAFRYAREHLVRRLGRQ